MKKTIIAFLALAFALALVLPARAQDPAASATTGLSATSATTRSAGPTELTGSAADQQAQSSGQAQNFETKPLRKEIVKLKYVRAQDIQNLLYAYVSREGHIQFNPNMPSILSVSDTPENVEKILAAIREIDVKPADVLYTIQLVLGSETEATTDPELKNDPIVKELGKLLRFKGYTLLDVTLVRTINRESAAVKFGPKAEFELILKPDVAGDAKMPVIKTDVRLRQTQVNSLISDKTTATYKIGPGDLLDIAVFQVPDLNKTVRVAKDGQISVPLLGRVDVAGLTQAGVAQKLTDLWGKSVNDPKVAVVVQEEPTVAKTEVTTLIESTLNIKSGDRTVVGVSKLDGGDKGLILIISAKIVD